MEEGYVGSASCTDSRVLDWRKDTSKMNVALQKMQEGDEPRTRYRLFLLGEFGLTAPQGHAIAVTSRKNRALLAILALSPGQAMSRERLAGLLWVEAGRNRRETVCGSRLPFSGRSWDRREQVGPQP